MIIFVDESGDPGLKIDRGSSRYLILAFVIFDSHKDALQTTKRLNKFRKKYKYSSSYEFKFNKTKKSIKIDFLKYVNKCNFSIRTIILDKEILGDEFQGITQNNIYEICLRILLKETIGNHIEIKLRIDGKVDRELRKSIKTSLRIYLKEEVKSKILMDLKIVDSKTDDLIQLSDMVVGSIRRSFSYDKSDSVLYKRIIDEKIGSEKYLKKSDLVSILK